MAAESLVVFILVISYSDESVRDHSLIGSRQTDIINSTMPQ